MTHAITMSERFVELQHRIRIGDFTIEEREEYGSLLTGCDHVTSDIVRWPDDSRAQRVTGWVAI